jgi:DNA-binding Lrp family transcriptional regulator
VAGNALEQQILSLFRDVRLSYSILQMAKKLKTSYPHVHKKVQEFIDLGILKKITVGPSHLCRLNLESDYAICLLALNEVRFRDKFLGNYPKKAQLHCLISHLKSQSHCDCVLFIESRLAFVVQDKSLVRIPQKSANVLSFEVLDEDQLSSLLASIRHPASIVVVDGFEYYLRTLRKAGIGDLPGMGK